jgi:hypothetical protein
MNSMVKKMKTQSITGRILSANYIYEKDLVSRIKRNPKLKNKKTRSPSKHTRKI